jgi:hypothetical protein
MPVSTAWGTLSNYESQDLVRRRYKEKHGGEANASLAKEIRSSITQARGYFEAAMTADRTVKPLLLYYGVLGLARALVMYLDRRREATLSQSHGISAKEWSSVFSQPNPDLGTIQVDIGKGGALPEFARATQNISLLQNNSSAVNLGYPHGSVPADVCIEVRELFSRLPEIGAYYTRWRGLPNFCEIHNLQPDSGSTNVYVNKRLHGLDVDLSFVQNFFGSKQLILQKEEESVIWFKADRNFNQLPIFWDHRNATFGTIGSLVFVRSFPCTGEFSKPVATFILSYALGMLVRYFPSRWMSLVRNENGDECLPTILATIDFIESQFPQMILEFLEISPDIHTADR